MISDLGPVMLPASAWQTLMTLIAPGGQMRLSPWIQAAQAKVVFKCDIRPQHREEDWRKLIKSQAARLDFLSQVWLDYLRSEHSFPIGLYSSEVYFTL